MLVAGGHLRIHAPIEQAISSTNPDVFYNTGCTAGTGEDTIVLAPGEHYRFDHFWEGDGHNIFGPTATPIIVSKITIQGNGATLQAFDRFSPRNWRLFAIGTTGNLTLSHVYIKGFHIKGGDGANGGGGGLGVGGAIYNEGSLTIEYSTFENNGAVGGNGSGGTSGGGGGLFGSGGLGCQRSAGGGGGSRGDAGNGSVPACFDAGGGGGGGGTLLSGMNGQSGGQGGDGGAGGFDCGGKGGDGGTAAHPRHGGAAPCEGGGGGGAGGNSNQLCFLFNSCFPEGGKGGFGGGGGGGIGDGGVGGFGGGGGAAYNSFVIVSGGWGGFGGGGGASGSNAIFNHPGAGGKFGGHADETHGGGGGALGGAIFNRTGTVTVHNSTFFNNFVACGNGGGGSADNGADAGGAIFSMGKSLEVNGSTFSGNQGTGSGAGIVLLFDSINGSPSVNFTLNNTIIANNGANECFLIGNVTATGVANLIMHNGSGTGMFRPCPPGAAMSVDPQLLPLQVNIPGDTPTMAITTTSPAADRADPQTSLADDQRGVSRPQGAGPDIGAFEATSVCPEAIAFLARANAIVAIDATHTTAYNRLICGLVEDGTYSKLDALYVLATQSDGGTPGDGVAKLNLIKDSFNLVRHGMCAFAADKGVACDGASGYYDTQFNLATSGVAFSRDSASLGVYDRTNITTNFSIFGAFDGNKDTSLFLTFNGGLLFRINSGPDAPVATNTNTQGFWIGIRSGPNAVSVYRNGNQIASSTTPSNGVPPLSMYLFALNFAGTASYFVPDEVAAFFIGGALNKTQAAGISVRINQFLMTFGTNVY
jgi:hypothetical protein